MDRVIVAWDVDILKMLLAVLVGALIGTERELRGKPAGMRTMTLITLGSTLFTIFSIEITKNVATYDPGRIAAQIVTGVGFLGAGAILHERKQVTGLTTAASIWLASSLGIGIGMGAYETTFVACVVVLVILSIFGKFELWLEIRRDVQIYVVDLAPVASEIDRLRTLAHEKGLKVSAFQVGKKNSVLKISFRAVGAANAHDTFVRLLMSDPGVVDFQRFSHDRTTAA